MSMATKRSKVVTYKEELTTIKTLDSLNKWSYMSPLPLDQWSLKVPSW